MIVVKLFSFLSYRYFNRKIKIIRVFCLDCLRIRDNMFKVNSVEYNLIGFLKKEEVVVD